MRRAILFAAALVILSWHARAQPDCHTHGPQKHCSATSAKSGIDTFRTYNGNRIATFRGINIIDRSGVFDPRIEPSGAIVGQSEFKIEWQIGAFSCVTYTVEYCTR